MNKSESGLKQEKCDESFNRAAKLMRQSKLDIEEASEEASPGTPWKGETSISEYVAAASPDVIIALHASLQARISTLSSIGAEQVLVIQELRQVVKEYRLDHAGSSWFACIAPSSECRICHKADALLAPKVSEDEK